MKKILFVARGNGGVNFYRILTPFLYLKKNDVNYNYYYDNNVDYSKDENIKKLYNYDFIVYNKTILADENKNLELLLDLKKNGIKLFLDIDDYWDLDKSHYMHLYTQLTNDKSLIISNIKHADVVTTTNNYLLNKIKLFNTNVSIIENGYDETIMKQFKSNWKEDNKRVRISYIAGSTHSSDIKLLDGVVNLLLSDKQLENKFIIQNCGFFVGGTGLKREINEDFFKVIKLLSIPEDEILKELISYNFDLTKIKRLPDQVKTIFKDKIVKYVSVPLEPKESPYYEYEKVLTNNHRNLSNQYVKFLHTFKNEKYNTGDYYQRKWSKDIINYMEFYDDTDIVLAPLVDNEFNRCKSNLKMVESLTRKLPIICSNVQPYKELGINMKNSILIDNKKNSDRDWYKAIKNLILNKEKRIELGNNLYNDLSENFKLKNILEKRIELFKEYDK